MSSSILQWASYLINYLCRITQLDNPIKTVGGGLIHPNSTATYRSDNYIASFCINHWHISLGNYNPAEIALWIYSLNVYSFLQCPVPHIAWNPNCHPTDMYTKKSAQMKALLYIPLGVKVNRFSIQEPENCDTKQIVKLWEIKKLCLEN